MTRALSLVAVGALIFAGANARADDATTHTLAVTRAPAVTRTPANRRIPKLKQRAIVQLSACMAKRMVADKSITYYDAMKICQDQLNRMAADSASRALLASVTAATTP